MSVWKQTSRLTLSRGWSTKNMTSEINRSSLCTMQVGGAPDRTGGYIQGTTGYTACTLHLKQGTWSVHYIYHGIWIEFNKINLDMSQDSILQTAGYTVSTLFRFCHFILPLGKDWFSESVYTVLNLQCTGSLPCKAPTVYVEGALRIYFLHTEPILQFDLGHKAALYPWGGAQHSLHKPTHTDRLTLKNISPLGYVVNNNYMLKLILLSHFCLYFGVQSVLFMQCKICSTHRVLLW